METLAYWFWGTIAFGVWSYGMYYLGVFHGIRLEREDQYEARAALNGSVVQQRRT